MGNGFGFVRVRVRFCGAVGLIPATDPEIQKVPVRQVEVADVRVIPGRTLGVLAALAAFGAEPPPRMKTAAIAKAPPIIPAPAMKLRRPRTFIIT